MTKDPSSSTTGNNHDVEIRYPDALAELDTILRTLEGEAVDVDLLGAHVKRAAFLITLCRERITSAQLEIETVVADLDKLREVSPDL
jgi:exodeoxyribonuclease VII small subunit